jgi:hypothetical protein
MDAALAALVPHDQGIPTAAWIIHDNQCSDIPFLDIAIFVDEIATRGDWGSEQAA